MNLRLPSMMTSPSSSSIFLFAWTNVVPWLLLSSRDQTPFSQDISACTLEVMVLFVGSVLSLFSSTLSPMKDWMAGVPFSQSHATGSSLKVLPALGLAQGLTVALCLGATLWTSFPAFLLSFSGLRSSPQLGQ